MRTLPLLVVALLLPALVAHAQPKAGNAPLPTSISRVAFGSCARHDKPQPIWDAVLAAKPDLFIFAGDNIYADTLDMEKLAGDYARLGAQPGYAKLWGSVPVLATWDDHDYGLNDAGGELETKRDSQRVMLDFFGVASDSPRRQREGVYDAVTVGEPGRRVQVILLDTRYHRSPLVRNPADRPKGVGPYVANPDGSGTVLGEAQWAWLREQLARPAEVRLLVSSIQVVAGGHGWEGWYTLPHERRRLLDLIRETGADGVIVLSGDRHHAEISRLPAEEGVGYPLYDFTSSGLNQGGHRREEPNRYRVAGDRFVEPHFGLLAIDWEAGTLTMEVRREDGSVGQAHDVRLDVLRMR